MSFDIDKELNMTADIRTLCEVLREINDLAVEHKIPEITELVKECIIMGKKMSVKMEEYRPWPDINTALNIPLNPNYHKNLDRRKGRV